MENLNSKKTNDIYYKLFELCIAFAYSPIDDLEKIFNKHDINIKYEDGKYKPLDVVFDELRKIFKIN